MSIRATGPYDANPILREELDPVAPIPPIHVDYYTEWKKLMDSIARLYQQDAPAEKLVSKAFNVATGNKDAGTMEFPTANLTVVRDVGSLITAKQNDLLTAQDAYALIKSLMATPVILNEGVKLEIVDKDGKPKAETDITDNDRKNLALCLTVALKNGLNVVNEEHIRFNGALKGKGPLFGAAETQLNAYLAVTDNPANPSFAAARAELDQLGTEPSVGKMRATINANTGTAYKIFKYLSEEDFRRTGEIQGDLLAIRDKALADPAKMALLPKFGDKPDLFGLIGKHQERENLMAQLGVTPDELIAAREITKGGPGSKGVPQVDGLKVPLGTDIHEKAGFVLPEAKKAHVTSQAFERLMSDIERLQTTGITQADKNKAADIEIFKNDSDTHKEIQPYRKQLDAIKKSQPVGTIVDFYPHIDKPDMLNRWVDEMKALYGVAREAEAKILDRDAATIQQKQTAIDKLQSFAWESQAYHGRVLAPPTPAPAPVPVPRGPAASPPPPSV